MRVLVVLPTYNEAANIENVLGRVRKALSDAAILVVDDSSPDGTAKIARDVGATLGGLDVLDRPAKSGLGSAYRDGFAWGLARGYDVLVEMDSDLQHDPDVLPELLAPLAQGFEVAIGSRYVAGGSIPNWSLMRRLLSRGGNLYADAVLSLGVKDSTAGFRAYSADVLARIDLTSVRANSYGFQIEMTYRAIQVGAKVREVPIRFSDRESGTSKMSSYTVIEALALVTWWGLVRVARGLQMAVHGRTADSSGPKPRR